MPLWLIALDRHFPIRYLTLLTSLLMLGLGLYFGFSAGPAPGLALLGAVGAFGDRKSVV